MSSVSVPLGRRSRATVVAGLSWREVWPVLAPSGLLVAGGLVGYPLSLDEAVARERLLGLVVASLLAVAACVWLRRVERPAPLLVGTTAAALLAGVWVISATGLEVFRGTVGTVLQLIFRPVFGLVKLTDPVEVTNTRFIVGYNGLADLCLVAIFCCGALLRAAQTWRTRHAVAVLGGIGVSLILLVGTGARGGLTGLAAGVCLVGLFAWPRRYALLTLVAAPVALVAATVGILDKGIEFSSTAGRLAYWGDLARLLVEYPLTGVGLGVDTANRVALQYEINPDPDRIFYAHNTFVQSYLELGPLGALGMLLVPVVVLAAAYIARRDGVAPCRRTLLIAGLGIVGALEAHGLTDQVVTTNVGTGLLLLGLAAVVAALTPAGLATLARATRRTVVGGATIVIIGLFGLVVAPSGRAQVLLNVGGLELNQALALDPLAARRGAALATAENTLSLALGQDATHPAVLRELARVRSTRFDDAAALAALRQAAESNRLDAFDMLQLAHLYRDFGFAEAGYAWAARAYATWGRLPADAVIQLYAQSTLAVLDDDRARTLATQAEAAMRARTFGEARALFQQALWFQPDSPYLLDRLGAAQRAVAKYGEGT
ncbi:MAG: O-antigen ligase family protein [Chloroflexi bacterium]|nr:O-antigen ligase family protein [Chloroflexota bacterium]